MTRPVVKQIERRMKFLAVDEERLTDMIAENIHGIILEIKTKTLSGGAVAALVRYADI